MYNLTSNDHIHVLLTAMRDVGCVGINVRVVFSETTASWNQSWLGGEKWVIKYMKVIALRQINLDIL